MGFEDFIRERAAVKYAEKQKERDFQHAEKEADRQNARDIVGVQGANQLAVGAQGAQSHEKIAGMNNAAHVRGIETGGQFQLAGKAMDNQGAMDRELTKEGAASERAMNELGYKDAWQRNVHNIEAAKLMRPTTSKESLFDENGKERLGIDGKPITVQKTQPGIKAPDYAAPNPVTPSEPRQVSSTPTVSYAPAPVTIQRDVSPALAVPGGGYRSVYQPPAAPSAPVGSQPGTRADALFGVGSNGAPLNSQPTQPVPVNTIQGPNGTVLLTNRQGAQASATGVPPVAQPTAPATQPTPAPAPQQTAQPPINAIQSSGQPPVQPAPAQAAPAPAPGPTVITPRNLGRPGLGDYAGADKPLTETMAPAIGVAKSAVNASGPGVFARTVGGVADSVRGAYDDTMNKIRQQRPNRSVQSF